MRHNVYDSYQEAQILSSSPIELVCLLYRGAIEAIADARRYLAGNDIAGRARAINKALGIVVELSSALDRRKDARLSRDLAELYDYVQRRLIEANRSQVDPPLAEAQTLLNTLLEAWESCEPQRRPRMNETAECEYESVSVAG